MAISIAMLNYQRVSSGSEGAIKGAGVWGIQKFPKHLSVMNNGEPATELQDLLVFQVLSQVTQPGND